MPEVTWAEWRETRDYAAPRAGQTKVPLTPFEGHFTAAIIDARTGRPIWLQVGAHLYAASQLEDIARAIGQLPHMPDIRPAIREFQDLVLAREATQTQQTPTTTGEKEKCTSWDSCRPTVTTRLPSALPSPSAGSDASPPAAATSTSPATR